MRKNLFFDLECVPGVQWFMDQAAMAVQPPANYKSQEALDKWEAENGNQKRLEAMAATCFKPLFGKIVCISWALDDGIICSHTIGQEAMNEHDLLQQFWGMLYEKLDGYPQGVRWVGHNVSGFDIPYMRARCLVNKVSTYCLPPRDTKPWDTEAVCDTLAVLAGKEPKGHSLANMCRLFGIEDGMPDIDGSQVWPMFKDGKFQEIAMYCRNDVAMVRSLYYRIRDWL